MIRYLPHWSTFTPFIALIVLAFETLALSLAQTPRRLAPLLLTITRAVGAPNGIVAGQAWESEPSVCLETYQRSKTGSLFMAATMAGAIASGGDPTEWEPLGGFLGEAYQVADDIADAAATSAALGKPIGRDVALGRPSSAIDRGIAGSVDHLKQLIQRANASIPPCQGAAALKALVQAHAKRILPEEFVRHALAVRTSDSVMQLAPSPH